MDFSFHHYLQDYVLRGVLQVCLNVFTCSWLLAYCVFLWGNNHELFHFTKGCELFETMVDFDRTLAPETEEVVPENDRYSITNNNSSPGSPLFARGSGVPGNVVSVCHAYSMHLILNFKVGICLKSNLMAIFTRRLTQHRFQRRGVIKKKLKTQFYAIIDRLMYKHSLTNTTNIKRI